MFTRPKVTKPETETLYLQDRDETETFQKKTSRDRLETETFNIETTSLFGDTYTMVYYVLDLTEVGAQAAIGCNVGLGRAPREVVYSTADCRNLLQYITMAQKAS